MALSVFYSLLVSLAINGAFFIAAFRLRTDRLVDLSYALSFIALVLYSTRVWGVSAVKGAAACMVALWAIRLGTFLFVRVRHTGKDRRFDKLRGDTKKFGRFWFLQATAVWLVSLPMLLLFLEKTPSFTKFSVVGIIIWALGLLVETVADRQKYRFTSNPTNKGAWIGSGLWGYSRHPNYFGEILVWFGIYLYVFPALSGNEAIIALASPVFVFVLVRYVSGVPILEKLADERWGKTASYQAYKQRTSLLIPLPPKHV